ncbi:MAG: hypothetical protein HQ588_04475 [Deltaproteobacteria bacterium]|nr:hypothetical protein [Deltaproteobacteria bacterium]
MKKIGLLCLALVLALGALGVGYAAWTDSIDITGTVNTGSVEIDIVTCSNTWVWKVVGNTAYPDEIAIIHDTDEVRLPAPTGTYTELVAYADAEDTSNGTKEITVTIDNAFPLDIYGTDLFCADAVLHYVGSIPVIAYATLGDFVDLTPGNGVDDAALLDAAATVMFYDITDAVAAGDWSMETLTANPINGPVQMHYCDYVLAVLCLDLPENPDYMNLSASFTATLNVIQWNEYPE